MAALEDFQVDSVKVDEFLKRHTKTAKCPFCECENWTIPVADRITVNAIPWGRATGDMYMTGLAVLVMICTNCAFVRMTGLHTKEILDALAEVKSAE